jgi:hypothetical protein
MGDIIGRTSNSLLLNIYDDNWWKQLFKEGQLDQPRTVVILSAAQNPGTSDGLKRRRHTQLHSKAR